MFNHFTTVKRFKKLKAVLDKPARCKPALCTLCMEEKSRPDEVKRHYWRKEDKDGIHVGPWDETYCLTTADYEEILRSTSWDESIEDFENYYLGFLGYESVYDWYWDCVLGVRVSTAETLAEFWS